MVGRRRPDARAAPAARCRHHGASRCGGGGGRIADPIRPAGAASMLHVLILSLSLKPGRMPPPARQRPVSMTATLGEKDVAELLSGKEYAMDISSITEGSEKETYIGQGSGVNAGTGIGALAGWVKGLVGKYLARKNRPVYEDLWQIIDGDLLTMVQEHEPALEQRRTWFTEPGDAPAAHTFATADGKCEGTVAAYKGGRVDWITTCKFFSSELGFGNLRIDGWATRAPLPRSPGPRTGRPTSVDTCLFSSAPGTASSPFTRVPCACACHPTHPRPLLPVGRARRDARAARGGAPLHRLQRPLHLHRHATPHQPRPGRRVQRPRLRRPARQHRRYADRARACMRRHTI